MTNILDALFNYPFVKIHNSGTLSSERLITITTKIIEVKIK